MAMRFEAHFSDGRTAARRKVSVRLDEAALIIDPLDDPESRILTWSFDDLRLADETGRGKPVRLSNAAQSDARLSFADDAILEPLLARAPRLRDPGVMGRRPGLRIAQWAGGIGAIIIILVFGLPRAAEPVAALMPLAWEEALGEQLFHGFGEGVEFCNQYDGAAALKRLTDRLTATMDSRYTIRVAVADSGQINAFAAPGGYIVLYRGLIGSAQSPDDVAGVLAHEIGHVVERHGTERMVRAAGLAAMVQLLLGDPSGLLSIGVAGGELLLSLAYSRSDEAEADAVAVDILAAAEIDSAGFVHFLERMARDEGGRDIPFLSSHPRSAERAAEVRESGGHGGPAMSEADWWELRAICGNP